MRLKAITAALTAAFLAVGMAACNRDNAGAGSSARPDMTKQRGSAAGGSSAPASPSSPSSLSSPSSPSSPSGSAGSSSAGGSGSSGSSDSGSSSSSK